MFKKMKNNLSYFAPFYFPHLTKKYFPHFEQNHFPVPLSLSLPHSRHLTSLSLTPDISAPSPPLQPHLSHLSGLSHTSLASLRSLSYISHISSYLSNFS